MSRTPRTGPVTPWNPSRRAVARVKDPLAPPTTCPHCGGPVRLVENKMIYGRNYGEWPWAYVCVGVTDPGCDAYVGVHPFTDIPLGTLADKRTREARKRAKAAFNPIWESGRRTRGEAYAWLAAQLGIPVRECHIGWFDAARCDQVCSLIAAARRSL